MNDYQIYDVGIYGRLSKEDEKRRTTQDTSDSIQNQLDFLTDYVIKKGWNLVDRYWDDGYTGTNFDRPDFQRMINDIEDGKINCVITKDLSRLGRNYTKTGIYIEEYFPSKKVRYIAVNDNTDSDIDDDIVPFKNLFNDYYAKDISKKVRTAKHTKVLNGDFIGGTPPYGYLKAPNNRHKLIIDEETAPIVKRIYSLYMAGMSKLKIANQLTIDGVPTPSQYRNLKATQKKHKGVWNETSIREILHNPTYAGHLTQNKSRKVSYKVDKVEHLSKSEWIIVENTHEPIINEKDFEITQQLLAKRTYHKGNNKPNHLLSGIAKCADCGGSMTFIPYKTWHYMVCMTWQKNTKVGLCTSHNIREDYVRNEVINALKYEANKHLDNDSIINSTPTNYDNDSNDLQKELDTYHRKLEDIKNIISNLYKDKVRGVITEDVFMDLTSDYNNERSIIIIKNIERVQNEVSRFETMDCGSELITNILKEFLTFENIDRTTLVSLVNRVEIHKDKSLKIHFNFRV